MDKITKVLKGVGNFVGIMMILGAAIALFMFGGFIATAVVAVGGILFLVVVIIVGVCNPKDLTRTKEPL